MEWIRAIPPLDFGKQTMEPSSTSWSMPSHPGWQEVGEDSTCVCTRSRQVEECDADPPLPSPQVHIPTLFTVFLADEEQKTKEFIL